MAPGNVIQLPRDYGGRDVTASVGSSYVRAGTLFGIDQDIDVSALDRRDGSVATWLAPALGG